MLERLSQLKNFAVESFSNTIKESFDFAAMVAKRAMELKNSMVDSLKNLVNKTDNLVSNSMNPEFKAAMQAMSTQDTMGQKQSVSALKMASTT